MLHCCSHVFEATVGNMPSHYICWSAPPFGGQRLQKFKHHLSEHSVSCAMLPSATLDWLTLARNGCRVTHDGIAQMTKYSYMWCMQLCSLWPSNIRWMMVHRSCNATALSQLLPTLAQQLRLTLASAFSTWPDGLMHCCSHV